MPKCTCEADIPSGKKFCAECGQPVQPGEAKGIQDAVINRSNIGQASVGNIIVNMGGKSERVSVCAACSNPTSKENIILICNECDVKFCQLCELSFRRGITRKKGEPVLCKKCYSIRTTAKQPEKARATKKCERIEEEPIKCNIKKKSGNVTEIKKEVGVHPGEYEAIELGLLLENDFICGTIDEFDGQPFEYAMMDEKNFKKYEDGGQAKEITESTKQKGEFENEVTIDNDARYFLVLISKAREYTRELTIELAIETQRK